MSKLTKLIKIAKVITIPKPGKPPHELILYRPISLSTGNSKLIEGPIHKLNPYGLKQ